MGGGRGHWRTGRRRGRHQHLGVGEIRQAHPPQEVAHLPESVAAHTLAGLSTGLANGGGLKYRHLCSTLRAKGSELERLERDR